MTASFPSKEDIAGTPISLVQFESMSAILAAPRRDRATVVAVCNVHSVMSARRDAELAAALRAADVATPDGMPLVWALRALGHEQAQRVYGEGILRRGLTDPNPGASHFFFGSTPEVLEKVSAAARELNPDIRVAGTLSPPFRALTAEEEEDALRTMRDSGATIVWVGLGMPKQELWMHRVRHKLPGMALVGVGAAFDFLAGTKPPAPEWMRDRGLEWAYRFAQEPRRLWRRYIWNNPAYLVLMAAQAARHRAKRS
jgi:N-acetylglucosaminyldiphosphoundecaprenol N-acetyl-beta-D-mannosaminyltransferase